MLVEIIVTTVEESLLAEKYGADRLELIHSFADGGLSPDLQLAKKVCQAVKIPVSVMVRPHAKSFIYDTTVMCQINREIDFLVTNTTAANIVFGSLTAAGEIDFSQLESIIKQVSGFAGITYHRAIDVAKNTPQAFLELQNYVGSPLKRVLSSGGKATALAGVTELIQMQKMVAKPNGVQLLIGSGVKPDNAARLIEQIGCQEVHLGTGVRNNNGELEPQLFNKLRHAISTLSL